MANLSLGKEAIQVIFMFNVIGLFLTALLLGTMCSFILVTSPTVFKTLDKEYSQKFLRNIFPRLFKFCTLITVIMGFLFVLGGFVFGIIVSLLVTTSFIINTYILTPKMNLQRDLSLTGDKASEKSFKILHLTSVLLYLLNIFLAVSSFIVYFV